MFDSPCRSWLASESGVTDNNDVEFDGLFAGKPAPAGGASLERIAWHPDVTFHQHPRTAAHDGLVHGPFAVDLAGFGANAQGARRMAETHCIAFDTARRKVDQGAGNRC